MMSMKFRAHETFAIRKGWLPKGIRAVENNPGIFSTKGTNPMDELGIGSNMVKSLRYWLQATCLTEEPSSGKRTQSFTPFGEIVKENDRYMEEIGTLFFLHYKLASNKEMATAWYYFFNEFQMTEFTKDDFVDALSSFVTMQGEEHALRSYSDDFSCIVNTYLPRYKVNTRVSPESNIECPLGELGLIDLIDRTKYKKSIPSTSLLNSWIILAVIMDQANKNNEISLNDLLTKPCNIGRIFNLDSITMLDLLHEAEKTGLVKVVRTAGLDILRINEHLAFDDCVNNYYEGIKNSGR